MAQRLSIRTSNRSLTSLLQYIKQGSIQVPQFQRGFIWERDNIKNLQSHPLNSCLDTSIWLLMEIIFT